MRRVVCFVSLLAAVTIGACRDDLDIPKPGEEVRPLPALPQSEIVIPVKVPLAALYAEIERHVPRQQNSNGWMTVARTPLGDLGIRYEVWRDSLSIVAADSGITITAPMHYRLEAAQQIPRPGGSFWQTLGSCGVREAPRDARIGMHTSLAWSPDWRIASTTRSRPTEFVNRCEATFLKIDVTPRVGQAFDTALAHGAALVDRRIGEMSNLRALAGDAWRRLQTPMQVEDGAWLVVTPTAAYVAPIAVDGDSLVAMIGITAEPKIILGDPPPPGALPLPFLQVRNDPALLVTLESSIGYDEASRRLAARLQDSSFEAAGQRITIDAVRVYGAGEKAVIEAKVEGDLSGTIYMIGRPVYDGAKGDLYLADLDFTIDTRNVLAKAAEWIAHGNIRDAIAERARWHLGGAADTAIARLRDQLRQLSTSAAPAVLSLPPIGAPTMTVHPTADAFVVRAMVRGS